MFNFMDRYKLWNCAAFKDDGGNGGGDDGGSDDKPAKNTIGQVSATGQYAGDGFEWVDSGSGYLTRTYTGAGSDNNLGQDVIAGGTADKNVKEAIATVSLNEGSQFAGSQASATDYDALDIFRSQDNQKASSSFAEQSGVDNYEPSIVYGDDAPAAQAMEKEESFGDAFARNRAAGADTFTYKGNLYTTDLAPSTPSTPSVSYDAFGNTYSTPQAAAEADQTMAQQSATANQAVSGTEEDLFEQPVVSESAQDYLDSLGTDFDFGQFDTPSIDYTVSQGEAGRGGPDSAAPGFTYVPSETPGVSTPAAGRDLDADLGIGMSDSTITADQYESGEGYGTYPTTLDGGSVSVADDSGYVDTLMETGDALSIVNAGGVDTSPPEKEETLGETILNALAGRSSIDRALGIDKFSPYIANVPVGVTQGIGALTSGLGQTIDQLAGTSQTNLALERMRDMGPMSNAQEEFMIRQAAEEGLRMRDTALKPRDETFYQAGSIPFDFAQEVMKPYYEETIPGYEGRENIYKNLETYEDVVGFEPGQIDRQLLDAAQAKQSPLETAVFGQGPGSAVRMDGSGFDPSTAAQKSIEGAGSTAPLLGLSLLGPLGTAAAIAGGQQSVTGELSQETDAALQGLYETGRLQNSDRFKQLVAANEGDEAAALKRMQQDARDLSQMPSAVLGGGATAVEAALLRMGLPGAAAIPIVEGLQEGPGESIAANQILQTVTGFGLPVNRQETLESGTAGIGGGATVSVPVSGAQAFVPSGPRAGKPAASTVPTSYTEDLMDTGMRGVGDVASDASSMEVIAAEKIIEDQVASTGTVDPKVAENLKDRTGLSSEEINNMAEKAGGSGPFVLTEDMRVDTPLQLTPEMRVQEGALQLTPEMRVPAEEAPVDLGGIPSRLTLTGAESLGPTTPDLSGIASNITFQPTAADQAVTSKMDADAAAPAQQAAAAAAQTALRKPSASASMDELNKAVDDIQSRFNLTFDEANDLVDNAYKALLNKQGTAPADTNYQNAVNLVNDQGVVSAAYVQRQLGISYDQAQDAVQRMEDEGLISAPNHVGKRTVNTEAVSAAATPEVKSRISPEIKALAEAARAEEAPVFTSVRTPDADADAVFTSVRGGIPAAADAAITSKMDADAAATQAKTEDLAATQEKDVAAVVELPEEFQEQLELPLGSDQTKTLEDDQTKTLEDDQTKTLEDDQTKTLEDDQTKTLEEDQTSTIVSVPVITQVTEPGEDDEVEVEVDDTTTTDTGDDVTVDVDVDDTFVPVITTTDDDGNTITECPEGYVMVETPDGPMCQKSVEQVRQRAGRGVQAYTGIVTRPGERGPGQKRKTTTRTERVRPTTRSA